MAVIGKIRRHSALIIALVGLSMASFVLSDLFKGNFGGIPDLAVIAGVEIDPRDYEYRVQEGIENYKENSQQLNIDQSTIDMIRNDVWNQLLDSVILGNIYEKTGITVSKEELKEMTWGKEPHSTIVKAFTNPKTGQFNPADVVEFLKTMDNDPSGKTRARWLKFEKGMIKERYKEKFYSLIKKGLYVTSKEVARDDEDKNKRASIRYVVKRFSAIPDSLIQPAENDLTAYYNEHKYEFKQKPSRSIEYVVFDVLPTPDDTLDIRDWIVKKTEEFKTTEDDTVFIASNADSPFDDTWHKQGTLSAQFDSLIFSVDTSTVFGPYIEDGAFKIVKLRAIAMRPDSVKARHILLKPKTANDTTLRSKADSIINLIKTGRDFAQLAQQLSEDQGSALNGGDLGWFAEGTMFKSFNDTCFAGKKGDIKIVNSQLGVHVIEITDQKELVKKVQIGIVDRKIEPGQKTFSEMYNNATRFAGENNSKDAFLSSAQKDGLDKRNASNLTNNDLGLPAIESSREVVRWAFFEKTGIGDVSQVFECGNKFIVALLNAVNEDEYSSLDAVKERVVTGARNDLKAKKIIDEIKNNDDNNLDDFAKNMNLEIQTASDITFATAFIPGIGREPAIVGYIFSRSVQPGKMSEPITGRQGVYIVTVESNPEYTPPSDLTQNRMSLVQNYHSRVDYELFEALKENAGIKDNRYLFY
ncbi:MAG: peptidylprolyl isomerase [Bacteroidetes bacterium]|nr:peptidylprolyl isomerase [Bacteroidota bacterium]